MSRHHHRAGFGRGGENPGPRMTNWEDDAADVAPRLLGSILTSMIGGEETAVRVVEVEAYQPDDPASHSFGGMTRRNASMFGPPGHLYVYRSYGIHWCANVVTSPEGVGAAVLLRAGIPLVGIDAMRRRRGRETALVDGPGKLTQALGITGLHDGADLTGELLHLEPADRPGRYRTTPRIGISKAATTPWRFVALD
jgi:DNA-3-methyladenine glycosylase